MAKVTIITSAYNAENYLEDCARSLLSQSFSDFKWILINDGSVDRTSGIIDILAKKDERIVPVHHKNKGSALSKNVGLLLVETPYFCFLDSDDLLLPNSLQYMLDSIEKCNADFVSFAHIEISDDFKGDAPQNNYVYEDYPLIEYDNPWDVKYKKYPIDRNNWNKIYKSSVFKAVCYEDLRYAEDVLLGWRHRKIAGKIAKCNLPIIAYRNSVTGLSRQPLTEKYLTEIQKLSKYLYEDFKGESKHKRDMVSDGIARDVYKYFVKKVKYTDDEIIRNSAKQKLLELYESKMFEPKRLSIKRRLILLLKGMV